MGTWTRLDIIWTSQGTGPWMLPSWRDLTKLPRKHQISRLSWSSTLATPPVKSSPGSTWRLSSSLQRRRNYSCLLMRCTSRMFMQKASFMTCSKGFMGECGIRGGYAEVVNMDPDVMAMLQKSISAKLCPTVVGQACMDVVVNPPKPGDPSYHSWEGEVANTLASYADRAKLVADTLNGIEGISCNTVQGAMYAFPNISHAAA